MQYDPDTPRDGRGFVSIDGWMEGCDEMMSTGRTGAVEEILEEFPIWLQ